MTEKGNQMTKKPRILVVDDEHTMRDFLTASMNGQYRVRTASDGKKAMEMLRRQPADLVLSDVRMPGGDGLTLLAEIQRDLADPPLVVMMTPFTPALADGRVFVATEEGSILCIG